MYGFYVNLLTVLSILLEDAPNKVQCGRLPFFPFYADRINGQNFGIVDVIKDAQQTINKREQQINNILASAANGGGGMDAGIVNNDENQMEEIAKNWNNPSYRFWTAPGASKNFPNAFIQFPRGMVPPELFRHLESMWDTLDRIIPQNAAADARTEGRQESGYLYAQKQAAIEVAQTVLLRNLEQLINDIGEAYYYQAQYLYTGVPREFAAKDGSITIVNEPVTLHDGTVGMLNDISALPRVKVTVTQSPKNVSERTSNRLLYDTVMKNLPAEYRSLRVAIQGQLLDTFDFPDEAKAKIEEGLRRAETLAQKAEELDIKAFDAQLSQLSIPAAPPGMMPDMPPMQPRQMPPQPVPMQA